MFLLLKYDPLSPEFGKIVDILLFNDIVTMNLKVYMSEVFVSHYNSLSQLAVPLDAIAFAL